MLLLRGRTELPTAYIYSLKQINSKSSDMHFNISNF